MHPKVLTPSARETIRALADRGCLDSWILAGGTGLALQPGHRFSEDLDLFGTEPFDFLELLEGLSAVGRIQVRSRSQDTLHLTLRGLRLSYLRAEAPLLFPGVPYRGLTLADPRDIAVMKVVAIGGRGSRKAFVDLFFFLKSGGTLEGVLALVDRRFKGIDHTRYHLLKSLVYFAHAEEEPMPEMIRPVQWETVKKGLVAEVRRLS